MYGAKVKIMYVVVVDKMQSVWFLQYNLYRQGLFMWPYNLDMLQYIK